jgi:glycosyltransferase involved in cell wall biosynthesis
VLAERADSFGASVNVLQIYPKSDYFTGAAIQLLDLAKGLAARGHHVVVATRPGEGWADRCAEAGLPYHAVPMRSEVDVRSIPDLVRILRRHHVQVVHCHKGKARTLALMAGLFVKIPVLILNRGVSFPLDPCNRLGYTTRRVTAIVAVSESIKRRLVAQQVPADKIHVIYSGTDTTRFHPGVDRHKIREELGLSPDHYLITQIGIRSWKGNDDTLDALQLIAKRAPGARLLFVGANPAKEKILRDKAAARELAGRVSVFLYREDIPDILAASDVCVDASYAGLGITGTLREALATETPVVGTQLEGNPELIEDQRTGLLVPARDPDALGKALLRLIEQPDLAKAMARAGRDRVVAMFSQETKILRTEALYHRLLQGTALPPDTPDPAPARLSACTTRR